MFFILTVSEVCPRHAAERTDKTRGGENGKNTQKATSRTEQNQNGRTVKHFPAEKQIFLHAVPNHAFSKHPVFMS